MYVVQVQASEATFTISQFWGNLDFLQNSLITLTTGVTLSAEQSTESNQNLFE